MTARAVDVCVVGSGASGSIVAHEIARNGFRVLVLEEGRTLPPARHWRLSKVVSMTPWCPLLPGR
ncbi:FAD-dependent oxidoreductase [Bradyrhizobium sp. RDT10]